MRRCEARLPAISSAFAVCYVCLFAFFLLNLWWAKATETRPGYKAFLSSLWTSPFFERLPTPRSSVRAVIQSLHWRIRARFQFAVAKTRKGAPIVGLPGPPTPPQPRVTEARTSLLLAAFPCVGKVASKKWNVSLDAVCRPRACNRAPNRDKRVEAKIFSDTIPGSATTEIRNKLDLAGKEIKGWSSRTRTGFH